MKLRDFAEEAFHTYYHEQMLKETVETNPVPENQFLKCPDLYDNVVKVIKWKFRRLLCKVEFWDEKTLASNQGKVLINMGPIRELWFKLFKARKANSKHTKLNIDKVW